LLQGSVIPLPSDVACEVGELANND
jgi:hypothetical protein